MGFWVCVYVCVCPSPARCLDTGQLPASPLLVSVSLPPSASWETQSCLKTRRRFWAGGCPWQNRAGDTWVPENTAPCAASKSRRASPLVLCTCFPPARSRLHQLSARFPSPRECLVPGGSLPAPPIRRHLCFSLRLRPWSSGSPRPGRACLGASITCLLRSVLGAPRPGPHAEQVLGLPARLGPRPDGLTQPSPAGCALRGPRCWARVRSAAAPGRGRLP